ncbi:unnamed protein product [Lactuca virosa]|uniref:Uncharacterized protein n=1 Tax=Lactuca virosa TaxID=75947 RepID=A0AAU9PEC9_9ASTR|nr:unnamed protein product [Lactuca virosa]
MLGSLDCLQWAWGCCPNAHKGQYTRGDHGYPAVILEAVASHDLWTHYLALLAPSMTLMFLTCLSYLTTCITGLHHTSFQVAGTSYMNGYDLVDMIYPKHACFVKLLSCPNDRKFKKAQEKARKDVE